MQRRQSQRVTVIGRQDLFHPGVPDPAGGDVTEDQCSLQGGNSFSPVDEAVGNGIATGGRRVRVRGDRIGGRHGATRNGV